MVTRRTQCLIQGLQSIMGIKNRSITKEKFLKNAEINVLLSIFNRSNKPPSSIHL